MVNRVILIGNLGRDPEVRHLESGASVAQFSIATTENYKDRAGEWQEQTEWHEIVVWRALAERAEAQLKKGYRIYLEGKLTHRSWQDQDGNNRKTTEVVGSYFRVVTKPREGGAPNSGYFPSAQDEVMTKPDYTPAANNPVTSTAPAAPADNSAADAEDDLPF